MCRVFRAVLLPLIAVIVSVGGQGAAQEIDLNSRLGPIAIVEAGELKKAVSLGGRVLALPSDPYIAFVEARLGDLFLIALSQGGNACPAQYVWLHAIPSDLRFSDVFGTCSDLIEVSYDSENVMVTMPSMVAGEGKVTFLYDGKGQVRERRDDVVLSGMARWDDWNYWAARHPYEMMAAADMRPRFVALMGADAYLAALARVAVASEMRREGDWIVGQGGEPHNAGEARTAVALNTRDGRLIVASKGEGVAPVLWGHPGAVLPGPIAAIMAMR